MPEQGTTEPEDPQDPLIRRLFLISPRPSFFERLGISEDHPASEVVGIITPKLRYERYFEGWRSAWCKRAKLEFLESFREIWASPYTPAEVAADFIQELQTDVPVDEVFDRWWTIRDRIELLEIDDAWRPS